MGEIRIRNLDDAVIARLARRAALNGRSLEQELREVLAAAAPEAPLSPEERLEHTRRLREKLPDLRHVDVEALVRSGRDEDLA